MIARFQYGACGCGRKRFDDTSCCGRPLDTARSYNVSYTNGVAQIRKPGDPVLWQTRYPSVQALRRDMPGLVAGFERGMYPRDAVHRGLATMQKGDSGEVEPIFKRVRDVGFIVTLSSLLEE